MFDAKKFIDEAVSDIKQLVGSKTAIIALSGGVDSATAAVLMHRAIGKHLISFFVDHGFMRKDEEKDVEELFKHRLGMNLIIIDARERFMSALKGVSAPEKKRKIIGEHFIRVFEEVAKKRTQNSSFKVQ